MLRTFPLSIISSFSLYTHQWSILILLASCMIYNVAACTVNTADDGQRYCPKHVEFYSKNKFEEVVHLVDFIVRILEYTLCNKSSVTQSSVINSVHYPLQTQRFALSITANCNKIFQSNRN